MHRKVLQAGLWVAGLLICSFSSGQCPGNIGFERGDFTGWSCLSGKINLQGVITTSIVPPIDTIHQIIKNVSPQARDPYGDFPVNCPNGSGYSIKLGHDRASGKVSGVAYTFTVPAGQDDYSIIYNYAVVLQNPSHNSWEQPKLTSKIFDIAANKYLDCGSFEFIAAKNLPGFKESTVEPNIFYKEWAPVTIKLTGLAGKTFRLEFTVNDCAQQAHFGYAYLDVDENCTTPITGNIYCNGTGAVVLKAPYGFQEYKWYDNQSNLVGTGNTVRLDPPPPGNTKYRLEITPFPNQGCSDTLETTIIAASDFMELRVLDTIGGCASSGANLSLPSVTAGSSPGLTLQYFTDDTQSEFVADPSMVTKNGTYYIKATAPAGCTEIKPVHVVLKKPLQFIVHPQTACASVVDLTAASVTAGSEAGLTYTYWRDTSATITLQNPQAISTSGKYFIKATHTDGCTSIQAAPVSIGTTAGIVLNDDIHSCGQLTFSSVNPAAGSNPGVQFSYWTDANTTSTLAPNHVFSSSTTIYARILSPACTMTRPIRISIHSNPVFTVTDPPPATRPATVDLFSTVPPNNSWTYTFWTDALATKIVAQPNVVALSGTYYVKASDINGCSTINPVNVTIIDPPLAPPNVFSPNNDGVNDTWLIPLLSAYANCIVEIYARDGRMLFRSAGYSRPWDGMHKGKPVPVGTYYYLIRLTPERAPVSGSVTIVR